MKVLLRSLNILRLADPRLLENVVNVRFASTVFRVIEPSPSRKLPEQLNMINHGEGATLPDAYKKFYTEWMLTEPLPVHYIPEEGLWKRDPETEEVKRIYNLPIRGYISPQLHQCITGGETIVKGWQRRRRSYRKKADPMHRSPRFWVPAVKSSVVYSEILNKHMSVLITHRVIKLIHEHQGFDTYILQTRACDLSTKMAVKIKRHLLMTLYNKDLPYDEEKNHAIYEKYKKYLIPLEELEWYGLTYFEALKKMKNLEEENMINSIVPLKHVYRHQLVEYLRNPPQDSSEEPQGFGEKLKSKFSQVFRRK